MKTGLKEYVVRIEEYLKGVLGSDVVLYSVEEAGSAAMPKIIVTLDKKSGVSVEECMNVHRLIINLFKEEEPLNYFALEVTSCGLTRVLKHDWEIEKNAGKLARFTLRKEIDGNIAFDGYIKAIKDCLVSIEDKDGRIFSVDYDNIKKIQLVMEERTKR